MAVQNFLVQDFVTICDPVRLDGSVHREMVVHSLMDAVAGARRTPGRHETGGVPPKPAATTLLSLLPPVFWASVRCYRRCGVLFDPWFCTSLRMHTCSGTWVRCSWGVVASFRPVVSPGAFFFHLSRRCCVSCASCCGSGNLLLPVDRSDQSHSLSAVSHSCIFSLALSLRLSEHCADFPLGHTRVSEKVQIFFESGVDSSLPPCFGKTVSWAPALQVLVGACFSSFLCCTPVARSLMTKCLSEGLTRSDPWITLGPGTRLPEVTAQGCSKNGEVETCDRVGSSRVSFRFSFREMTRVISRSSAQGPSGPEEAREAHINL